MTIIMVTSVEEDHASRHDAILVLLRGAPPPLLPHEQHGNDHGERRAQRHERREAEQRAEAVQRDAEAAVAAVTSAVAARGREALVTVTSALLVASAVASVVLIIVSSSTTSTSASAPVCIVVIIRVVVVIIVSVTHCNANFSQCPQSNKNAQNNVAPNGHLSFPNVTESRSNASARTSWVGDENDFSDWKVVIVFS